MKAPSSRCADGDGRRGERMIFNIQKCSIHDGTGIRTLVFFKGCPLRCKWCANPESQSYQREIMEFPARCIGCNACKNLCPESAISLTDGGYNKINRDLCKKCFRCVERCYAESKQIVGREYSVEELLAEIQKDRKFYFVSGGGVTFSGGEPLTQPKLLTDIARRCHETGIHVAIESCGYGMYEEFKSALPYIDYAFLDLKHIDSKVHKVLTGKGNELILSNIERIAREEIPITIRTPIIPGYNDSLENIIGISEFISKLPGVREYELLPYHNLGESKYKSLGLVYELEGVSSPSDEVMRELVKYSNEILLKHGKTCFYVKDNRKEIIK